jgi:hypothetical protein
MKLMYVAPFLREWKDMGVQLWGTPGSEDHARIKAPEGMPGVLLVFDSMEALQEVYPNVDRSKVITIQYAQAVSSGA